MSLEAQMKEMNAERDRLNKEVTALGPKIADLEGKLASAQSKITECQELIREQEAANAAVVVERDEALAAAKAAQEAQAEAEKRLKMEPGFKDLSGGVENLNENGQAQTGTDSKSVYSEYRKLKGANKARYYRENRDAIAAHQRTLIAAG